MSYIEFKNVSKTYQMGEVEIKALDKVSFDIDKGELVVILGPSGAGKTTCLNILGGMDDASSGKIIVDEEHIEKLKGSPVNPKIENTIHTIGFMLLMALMIFISYNDILRILK